MIAAAPSVATLALTGPLPVVDVGPAASTATAEA
jgi:hypothetical protein